MSICDWFFGRRGESSGNMPLSDLKRYVISRDDEQERRRAHLDLVKAKDEAATLRAINYVPPIKFIKGATQDFIEIDRSVTVPLALISDVTLLSGSFRDYYGPSGTIYIQIGMVSGTKHRVPAERASADLLLAAIRDAWVKGGAS